MNCLRRLLVIQMLSCAGATEPCALCWPLNQISQKLVKLAVPNQITPQARLVLVVIVTAFYVIL